VQHGLKYITLSDSINLSKPELNHIYSQAEITIRGSSPGKSITIQGESITYGITILRNAPNSVSAEKFVQWLLNPEMGGRVIEAAGQKLLNPAPSFGYESLPSALKTFTTEIIH
jgi:molybdate/tungstate transport system substrate-binding protein